MWVLVFPETVAHLPTAGEAGEVSYDVRSGSEASVCRRSGVYAGAWAGEGTTACDKNSVGLLYAVFTNRFQFSTSEVR